MKRLRSAVFWAHLVLGLAAGGTIAITAFTGAAMAFEKQVLAWADQDRRRVAPPADGTRRLTVDELLRKAREDGFGGRPAGFTISSDPAEAVILSFGRTNTLYANPYTGEFQPQGSPGLRAFFQCMLRWHRWLGVEATAGGGDGPGSRPGGDGQVRPRGNAAESGAVSIEPEPPRGLRHWMSTVVGTSAAMFMTLCVSGLYLWWPRTWRPGIFRALALPSFRLEGRARDFNWHNAVGFWSAPFLVVMSFTGIVMAFRGFGNFVYGPAPGVPGGLSGSQPALAPPNSGAKPLDYGELAAVVKREVADWESMTFRLGGGRPRPAVGRTGTVERTSFQGEGRAAQPIQVQVRRSGFGWVLPTQVVMDPYSGELLRKHSIGDQGIRQGLRQLNRTIHTGESGGLPGQIVAFMACLGGLLLVYTGLALAFRRFPRWRKAVPDTGGTTREV